MRELRVYVGRAVGEVPGGQDVFYSRRADGPLYRWRYEEAPGRWRFSRVRPSKLTLRVLSVASWEAVPAALRDRLGEHYAE
jgi:hypothetical protein